MMGFGVRKAEVEGYGGGLYMVSELKSPPLSSRNTLGNGKKSRTQNLKCQMVVAESDGGFA